jgi:hypothetical protein
VTVERVVLDGDERVEEHLRNLVELDQDPALLGERRGDRSVDGHQARHHRRVVVLERTHVRQLEAQEPADDEAQDGGENRTGAESQDDPTPAAPPGTRRDRRETHIDRRRRALVRSHAS